MISVAVVVRSLSYTHMKEMYAQKYLIKAKKKREENVCRLDVGRRVVLISSEEGVSDARKREKREKRFKAKKFYADGRAGVDGWVVKVYMKETKSRE